MIQLKKYKDAVSYFNLEVIKKKKKKNREDMKNNLRLKYQKNILVEIYVQQVLAYFNCMVLICLLKIKISTLTFRPA